MWTTERLVAIWNSLPGAKPKGDKKAKNGAPAAKSAPKAKKEESAGPREGSKAIQVVALLQRKSGATRQP